MERKETPTQSTNYHPLITRISHPTLQAIL